MVLSLITAITALTAGPRAIAAPRRGGRANLRAMALGVGDDFPPAALRSLGVEGRRAVVAFVNADDDFNDAKELRLFETRADEFARRKCALVAVRPPEGASEAAGRLYPSLTLHNDEEDAVRTAAGLPLGWRPRRPRATFLLAANGTVCEAVSGGVGSTEHPAFAARAVARLDDAEASAVTRLASDELRSSFASAAAAAASESRPPPAAAAVARERAAAREAAAARLEEEDAAAAQRAQAIRVEARWRATAAGSGDAGFAAELAVEADKAAAAASAAAGAASRARQALVAAAAAGGASSAEAEAKAAAARAAQEEAERRADERAMLRMQWEALELPLNLAEREAEELGRRADGAKGRAGRARGRAAAAEAKLEGQRSQDLDRFAQAQAASREEEDRRRLDALLGSEAAARRPPPAAPLPPPPVMETAQGAAAAQAAQAAAELEAEAEVAADRAAAARHAAEEQRATRREVEERLAAAAAAALEAQQTAEAEPEANEARAAMEALMGRGGGGRGEEEGVELEEVAACEDVAAAPEPPGEDRELRNSPQDGVV